MRIQGIGLQTPGVHIHVHKDSCLSGFDCIMESLFTSRFPHP